MAQRGTTDCSLAQENSGVLWGWVTDWNNSNKLLWCQKRPKDSFPTSGGGKYEQGGKQLREGSVGTPPVMSCCCLASIRSLHITNAPWSTEGGPGSTGGGGLQKAWWVVPPPPKSYLQTLGIVVLLSGSVGIHRDFLGVEH